MTDKRFELRGVSIFLDKNLEPTQMKEKGFINGYGKEIVTEVYVSEELYNRLKELEE